MSRAGPAGRASGADRWRQWRVGALLAVLAVSLAAVPGRVQAQRQSVADLASKRGAASAGGAFLSEVDGLRKSGEHGYPPMWRVSPGREPVAERLTRIWVMDGGPPTPYDLALEAVRARRASMAAAQATAGELPPSDAALVSVEDDLYLVVTPWSDEPVPRPDRAPFVSVGTPHASDGHGSTIPSFTIPGLRTLGNAEGCIVAWWPPVRERILTRTGIPLQVGGAPPLGRLILPSHELTGLPVWSLPTPEAGAAITLFDAGSLLWITGLAGLLAREYLGVRREAQQERARQGFRDSILQRLSHELRTPAASVQSLVDALDHPGTTESERGQFLELVRSEAGRLSLGIDRLLHAARGWPTLGVDRVPMELTEWAEGVRARWINRLPGLTLQSPGPCPAVADPDRLDEAADALLDNARKYGGPNVTLAVAPGRFSVEDDGEGIAPGDRPRVLEKFGRIEGRVHDPGGHGLGLWAVGEVARAHGGQLAIEGRSRIQVTLGSG